MNTFQKTEVEGVGDPQSLFILMDMQATQGSCGLKLKEPSLHLNTRPQDGSVQPPAPTQPKLEARGALKKNATQKTKEEA